MIKLSQFYRLTYSIQDLFIFFQNSYRYVAYFEIYVIFTNILVGSFHHVPFDRNIVCDLCHLVIWHISYDCNLF